MEQKQIEYPEASSYSSQPQPLGELLDAFTTEGIERTDGFEDDAARQQVVAERDAANAVLVAREVLADLKRVGSTVPKEQIAHAKDTLLQATARQQELQRRTE